jgi:hypothetical protein
MIMQFYWAHRGYIHALDINYILHSYLIPEVFQWLKETGRLDITLEKNGIEFKSRISWSEWIAEPQLVRIDLNNYISLKQKQ